MKMFVFLASGLLKMDFVVRVFVFLFQALWKTVLYPFYHMYFIVLKTRIVFSMKVFVIFLVSRK